MNRTKSAFKGAISSQAFMVINILITLFSVPYILKSLNSEIYGLSVILFQITNYLGMFDFGLGAGVSRYLAGTRGDDVNSKTKIQKIISTAFIVYGTLGILIAITGILFAPYAIKLFSIPFNYVNQVQYIISAICILVGLQFLLRTISGIFFAHQRQILSNTLSFILSLSNTFLTILFIYLKFELWSFVYAQIFVFIINSILNLYFFKKYYYDINISFKKFDFYLLKEMFSYGFFLFLTGIAVQIVFQTDRVIVGNIISLSAVSLYAMTSRLPELISQLIWKIVDNSFPAMVEISTGNKSKSFGIIHHKIMKLSISLSTIALWVVLLVSFPFLNLWVGKEYYVGLTFVILISYLYFIQLTFIHVTSLFLSSVGIVKKISIIALIEGVINLVLSIWLCKINGIIGVIEATIIAGLLTSAWYVPYLGIKLIKISVWNYFLSILKPLIGISAFGLIIYFYFSEYFKNIDNWGQLFLSTFILIILFLCFLILINRSLIKELKQKIFSTHKEITSL